MTDGEALLFQACDLRKTFGKEEVLHIERLKIRRGKVTAIVGASGSGKTTLLNILGGLDRPDDGARVEVWLGNGWSQLGADDLQATMARRASYAFQQGHLLPSATLRLNLSLASRGQAHESDFKEAILRAGLAPELKKDAEKGQDLLARRTLGALRRPEPAPQRGARLRAPAVHRLRRRAVEQPRSRQRPACHSRAQGMAGGPAGRAVRHPCDARP